MYACRRRGGKEERLFWLISFPFLHPLSKHLYALNPYWHVFFGREKEKDKSGLERESQKTESCFFFVLFSGGEDFPLSCDDNYSSEEELKEINEAGREKKKLTNGKNAHSNASSSTSSSAASATSSAARNNNNNNNSAAEKRKWSEMSQEGAEEDEEEVRRTKTNMCMSE